TLSVTVELVLAEEARPQALGDDAVLGQPSGKAGRNAILLELAVQPLGHLLVAVAVAEERIIARVALAQASRPRDAPLGRPVLGRQSGMLSQCAAPVFLPVKRVN